MNNTTLSKNSIIDKKVCMITGANGGIGKATAIHLANIGYNIILVCRSKDKALKTLDEIPLIAENQKHEILIADLAIKEEIRKIASEFKANHKQLDLLINNAAVLPQKERTLTKDGLEINFAVNHLGHFLLTLELLDIIKSSAPSRIITITSSAEKFSKFDINDLQLEHKYSAFRAYGHSKFANILFTHELARRLEGTGVTAVCINPGAVKTKINSSFPGFFGFMAKLYSPFALTPAKAANYITYLASDVDIEKHNGEFFEKDKPTNSSEKTYDNQLALKLWTESESLVGPS